MKANALLLIASVLLGGVVRVDAALAEGVRPDDRPNVLFIILDDLNDWTGFMQGHRNALTPNLDRLASQGVAFTDAHASSPLCAPSRAAFLSGIGAGTSGFHDNKSRYTKHPVLTKNENLPQFFKRAGYRTLGAGKVFHHGYPEYFDEYLQRGPRMYQAGDPKRNGLDIPGIFDWGPIDLAEEEMDDYRMAQFAIDQLKRTHDKPFFLACGIYLPHLPWYAPEDFFEPFPADKVQLPATKPRDHDDLPAPGRKLILNKYQEELQNIMGKKERRDAVRSYLAATHFADAQVGRILKALEASPYAEKTIVVLIGDHGNHLGEKQRWHKDTLWEESTRTPLIIRAPGMAGNGRACRRMASLLDIYPTLAELAGEPVPERLEGRSLVPLLNDPGRPWPHGAVTYRRPGQVAFRTVDWCYIRYEDGGEELYDRKADPGEWVNLAELTKYDQIKRDLAANPQVNL